MQFEDDRRRTDTFFFHDRILVIHAPLSRFSSFDQHSWVFAFMMDIFVIEMGERMIWHPHFCRVRNESSSWRVFSVRYKKFTSWSTVVSSEIRKLDSSDNDCLQGTRSAHDSLSWNDGKDGRKWMTRRVKRALPVVRFEDVTTLSESCHLTNCLDLFHSSVTAILTHSQISSDSTR